MKIPFITPKIELPALPDTVPLEKLLAEHDRRTSEITRNQRLRTEKQEIERDLALNANLEDPAEFRQLSDARLFIEICGKKLATFEQRQQALEPEIEREAEVIRMGLRRVASAVADFEARLVFDPMVARFVENKVNRDGIVRMMSKHSVVAIKVSRLAYEVHDTHIRDNPVSWGKRLLANHSELAALLPDVNKHLAQSV